MCTAISDTTNGFLFGRTLDLERSYNERVILTPRRAKLDFLHQPPQKEHPAILGIGILYEGTPLYFDAVNEFGVAIAALNFPRSAFYREPSKCEHTIASFELISYILSNCTSLSSAKALLENITITNESISQSLPASPLHWLIADKSGALTLECTKDGMHIYENPFGILTNEPPFPYHSANVTNFAALSSAPPKNTLSPEIDLAPYSRGIGGFGLPGDFSSPSRFVRALFAKSHTDKAYDKVSATNRFFHIMDTVSIPKGTVKTQSRESVYTVYTSCAAPESMAYYFSTYSERSIKEVNASNEERLSDKILSLSLNEGGHLK